MSVNAVRAASANEARQPRADEERAADLDAPRATRAPSRIDARVPALATALVPALAACFALLVAGCAAGTREGGPGVAASSASAASPSSTQSQATPGQTAQPPVQPLRVSADDLKKLRWIEGAWRGTGDVEKPFFERYRFENDTTLTVESFPDESLSKSDDVTRFELREGVFGNFGDGSRWAATALDETSVTFSPVQKARNTFRWQRESADLWQAVLDFPATADKPASRRTYRMERIKK